MLGLKRGAVALCTHDPAWETEAEHTISRLKQILGSSARDIQHVGSTAIPAVKAKPIIDIAVAMEHPADILAFLPELKAAGFHYRPEAQPALTEQLLFACGNYYENTGDLQTHFIHIVPADSADWENYILFRDYLNANRDAAKEYEALKEALAGNVPAESGRNEYTEGKQDFIRNILKTARET